MSTRKGSHHCTICRDPRLAEIEAARGEGLAYGVLARRFSVKGADVRHHFERGTKLSPPAEGDGPGGALPSEPGAKA